MHIRPFRSEDTDAVVDLWEAAGLTRPWNDPRKDIARKLTVQPELFVVAEDETGRILGTIMAGYDGHRGWMNYLATQPTRADSEWAGNSWRTWRPACATSAARR